MFMIKIANFGLATYVDNVRKHDPVVGTATYTAPEIYAGSGHGLPADIYSLGVIAQKVFNVNNEM